jgi:SAM-dependent methyltransferase
VITTAPDLRHYFEHTLGWTMDILQSRLVWQFLDEAARSCEGGAILDAGAGHQRYRPFFEGRCLYVSQEHPAGIANKGMQHMTYDILAPLDERIPMADDCFHGVLNTSVMEHVRHPERFIAEAFRVLKPGGTMFTHVPFTYPEHEKPYDFQRPTSYGLKAWFADAGFSEVGVMPASSNITAAVAHLEAALQTDLLQTGRVAEFHQVWDTVRPVVEFLQRIGDPLIHDGTDFPIGWFVFARKAGALSPDPYAADRATFLARYGDR